MQLAIVDFIRTEVGSSEEKWNFNFSKIEDSYLHTARPCHSPTACSTLQCIKADRSRAACSTRMSLVAHHVQVAQAVSSKTGSAHLHAPRNRRSPIRSRHYAATQLLHVVFYSTEHVIASYLQYTIHSESPAF